MNNFYEWIVANPFFHWIGAISENFQNGHWLIAIVIIFLPLIALTAILYGITAIFQRIKNFFKGSTH